MLQSFQFYGRNCHRKLDVFKGHGVLDDVLDDDMRVGDGVVGDG